MPRTLTDKIAALPKARRAKVKARTAALAAEERSLRASTKPGVRAPLAECPTDAETAVADARARFEADPAGALLDMVRGAGDDRLGTVAILNAVVEFLGRDQRLARAREWGALKYRLVEVATALIEAEDGRSTPLLAVKRKGGRQGSTRFERAIRGYAVVTLDLLEKTGLDRRGAAARVAKTLAKHGMAPRGGRRRESGRGSAVTAATVLAWRAATDAEHGKKLDDQIVREHLALDVAFKSGVEREALQADLLAKLEAVVRTIAQGKKLTPG